MATITTGGSATLTVDAGQYLDIVSTPNTIGTVARTVVNDGYETQVITDQIGPPQMDTVYGPYDYDCSITITCNYGSVTYIIVGSHSVKYTTDTNGISGFVGLDGEQYLGWEDLRFPAQAINPAGAVSAPSVDQTTVPGTLLFASNATNIIVGVAQLPHKWKAGTAVRPHIHWAKTSSASGGVVWQFSYAVADIGEVIPAYSSFVTASVGVSDSDTSEKHALAYWPEITMTGKKESTMIFWKIQRKHDDAADDYGANARLLEFDIHFQASKLGTINEIPT